MIFHIRQRAIRSYRERIDASASESVAHDAIHLAFQFVDLAKPERGKQPDGLCRYRIRTNSKAGKLSRGYLVLDNEGSIWDVQPQTGTPKRREMR